MRRGTELNHLPSQDESGEIADARSLLHIVSDDGDGGQILEVDKQLFDLCGADRIQRGTRLVQKQHFRFNGQSARDTQTLLLSAGKIVSGFMQLILHFLPQGGMTQTLLDDVVNGSPRTCRSGTFRR